jgi:glycosyltransferase involved in cell wall biosynthesis
MASPPLFLLSDDQPEAELTNDEALAGLRVLILAPHPFFQSRGTPIAVRMLVETLCASGHAVDVLTYHEGDDPAIPGCRVIRIRQPLRIKHIQPGFSVKKLICDGVMLEHCFQLLRENRYDLMHAVEEAVFIAFLARQRFGLPYVYDMDSCLSQQMIDRFAWLQPARPLMERLERHAMRNSVGVVAVCPSLAERARRDAPDVLVQTIQDTSLLDETTEVAVPAEDLRASIGAEGPLVLYVGNLEPYQGIDLLVEGFAHAAGMRADAHLIIIGGTPQGVRRYQERARSLGIGERVHLLGPRPLQHLGAYLRQADVLASPRITGTNTPLKIYSYLDSGTAVLATRLATHTQVMGDDVAILVEPESKAFGEGLLRLLRDPRLRQQLAHNAREHVRAEYSREAFARKVNGFYDAVHARLAVPPRLSLEPSP